MGAVFSQYKYLRELPEEMQSYANMSSTCTFQLSISLISWASGKLDLWPKYSSNQGRS